MIHSHTNIGIATEPTQVPEGVSSRFFSEREERFWCAGAPGVIPELPETGSTPCPIHFLRFFTGVVILFSLLLFCWDRFHNPAILPGVILLGAMAIPLSTALLFFDLNLRRNVSIITVGKLFIVGFIIALLYTVSADAIIQHFQLSHFRYLTSTAAVLEELLKLLPAFLLINRRRYPYLLNGLLFGAATGAGFACFSAISYAFNTLLPPITAHLTRNSAVLQGLIAEHNGSFFDALRVFFYRTGSAIGIRQVVLSTLHGLLSPFTQILWTALSSGALWLVSACRPFRYLMLIDIRFIGTFILCILLHYFWNIPWAFRIASAFDKHLAIIFVGCALLSWFIRLGLLQFFAIQMNPSSETAAAAFRRQDFSPAGHDDIPAAMNSQHEHAPYSSKSWHRYYSK